MKQKDGKIYFMSRIDILERIKDARKPIRIKISKEADLYDPLDPDGITLNKQVRDYIVSKIDLDLYMGRNVSEQIQPPDVQAVSKSKINKERFQSAICEYFDEEIRSCDTSLAELKKQEYGLLFFSVILYAGSIFCSGVINGVLTVILAAVGGFTSFQFCDYWLFRNRNCLLKKRAYLFLKNVHITQQYSEINSSMYG